jgi:DNA-binding response OmpR family regulator
VAHVREELGLDPGGLAELGIRVRQIAIEIRAREALARSRPLGIVLDMHLPDGRGELLLRELRAQVDPAPVIVVTVEGEPATALGLGADDYLTKPIDRARLSRWLERLNRPSTGPAVRAELVRAHSPG